MPYFLMNTDGGMVNPGNRQHDDPSGEAAVAVVLRQIRNGRDVLIDSFSGSIGRATNAEAEYRALIEGLRFALEVHEVRQLRAYVDSEFLVKHLCEKSKMNSDLRPLYEEAQQLLSKLDDWRLSWIPRERNTEADLLVQAILYN